MPVSETCPPVPREESSVTTPASRSPVESSELLDENVSDDVVAARLAAILPREESGVLPELLDNWENHLDDDDPSLAGEQARSAARSRIEELFASLEAQRNAAESRASQSGVEETMDLLEAEISRLRSDQITADEATFIFDGLLLHAPKWRIPDELYAKLSRLSEASS